jgi:hypothetical protein
VKSKQDFQSILIDLFLQLIDLFVICNCVCGEIVIALQQALNRTIETALSQASHHQQIIAQRRQRFIE